MSELGLNRPLPVGAPATRGNGWYAMILLIVTEGTFLFLMLFSYFYLWLQGQPRGWFPENGPPALTYAIPSSVIMIAGSVVVWLALRGIRRNAIVTSGVLLAIASLIAAAFIGLQWWDWAEKNFTVASTVFGSLYFTIGGVDMAHVFVGLVGMALLSLWTFLGYFNAERHAYIAIGALYWHFITVVWLAIFFTFYIAPRLWGG